MGTVADATLQDGGEVFGVLTESLAARETAHRGIPRLAVMNSMHERKAMMAARAESFVALPGGFGTTDELFEILTWSQLGLHRKPCAVLNVAGYFDGLLAFLDRAAEDQLLRPENRAMLLVVLVVVRMRGILATKFGDGRPWRVASSHASPHRFRLVPGVAAFLAARYFFRILHTRAWGFGRATRRLALPGENSLACSSPPSARGGSRRSQSPRRRGRSW